MKLAHANVRRMPAFVPSSPVTAKPQQPAASNQPRDAHRAFDYGVGYGNRSGYSAGRRSYADLPARGLFHCA